jgi:hypothetical protein
MSVAASAGGVLASHTTKAALEAGRSASLSASVLASSVALSSMRRCVTFARLAICGTCHIWQVRTRW